MGMSLFRCFLPVLSTGPGTKLKAPPSSGSARSLTRLRDQISAGYGIGEDTEGRKIFRPYRRDTLIIRQNDAAQLAWYADIRALPFVK